MAAATLDLPRAPSVRSAAEIGADGLHFHPCPTEVDCPHCRGTVAPALDWSFIDTVYCISLEERDDRMRLAAAELHRVGLCRRVLFYRPRRHPVRVIEGIWESHRAVARHALESGATSALILEDDAVFTRRITPRRLADVARTMGRLPVGWRLYFLGHWPLKARFCGWNLLATASACAHAYIASHRHLEWLDAHPFHSRRDAYDRRAGGGIDAAYATLPQSYAYFPMLAVQAVRGSDHMAEKKATRPVKKLRHLVTRTDLGEILLSRLMRPNELIMAGLGAAAGAAETLVARLRRRAA